MFCRASLLSALKASASSLSGCSVVDPPRYRVVGIEHIGAASKGVNEPTLCCGSLGIDSSPHAIGFADSATCFTTTAGPPVYPARPTASFSCASLSAAGRAHAVGLVTDCSGLETPSLALRSLGIDRRLLAASELKSPEAV